MWLVKEEHGKMWLDEKKSEMVRPRELCMNSGEMSRNKRQVSLKQNRFKLRWSFHYFKNPFIKKTHCYGCLRSEPGVIKSNTLYNVMLRGKMCSAWLHSNAPLRSTMEVMTGWLQATPTMLLNPAYSLCHGLKVMRPEVHIIDMHKYIWVWMCMLIPWAKCILSQYVSLNSIEIKL